MPNPEPATAASSGARPIKLKECLSNRVLIIDRYAVMGTEPCRRLGERRCLVDIFAENKSPSFRSRFCHRQIVSPPWRRREEFLGALRSLVQSVHYDAIFVCNQEILETIHTLAGEGCWKGLLLPKPSTLKFTFSKHVMTRMAGEAGVAVPRTLTPEGEGDALRIAAELGFPLMVKGEKGEAGENVRLARSATELLAGYREVAQREQQYGCRPALQEFIRGTAYSLGGLFKNGEPLRVCAHRKLLRYPPPHGGKTVRGVTERNPALLREAFQVFKALQYTGLGHVEFIEDSRDGRFVFLEINPRLWGTIGVARLAGVDLFTPYMKLAAGEDVEPDLKYDEGIVFHLLLRDVRLMLKRPVRVFGFIGDCLNPGVRSDFMWTDPGPHLRLSSAR